MTAERVAHPGPISAVTDRSYSVAEGTKTEQKHFDRG
jgi:hypothetical protein